MWEGGLMITPIPNYPGYFIDEDGNLYSKMGSKTYNVIWQYIIQKSKNKSTHVW